MSTTDLSAYQPICSAYFDFYTVSRSPGKDASIATSVLVCLFVRWHVSKTTVHVRTSRSFVHVLPVTAVTQSSSSDDDAIHLWYVYVKSRFSEVFDRGENNKRWTTLVAIAVRGSHAFIATNDVDYSTLMTTTIFCGFAQEFVVFFNTVAAFFSFQMRLTSSNTGRLRLD